jgi:DNA-binding IclR family transcriptional regulator
MDRQKSIGSRPQREPSPATRPSAGNGAQAIQRAVALLRLVASSRGDGARLSDIAEQAALTIPTTRRILKSLVDDRMIIQVEGRRYAIGPLAAELGLAFKGNTDVIARWRPLLEAVGKHTGDTVYLIERGGLDSVVLDRVDGTSPVRAIPFEIGQRNPLGIGTGSLAILASLEDEEVDHILASNDRQYRLHDGLDRVRVRSMVERVRRFGYAMTLKTSLMPGVTGFSVALPHVRDQVHLAVSIASVGNVIPREKRQILKQMLLREIGKVRPS